MTEKKRSKRAKAHTAKEQPKKTPYQEKLFENLLRVTYEFIKGRRYMPMSKDSLIDRLKIHPDHFAIFESVLRNLKEQGKIGIAGDQYVPSLEKEKNVYKGQLKVHPRGFGFATLADSPYEDDVFIPKPYMNGAVDGDEVEVQVAEVVSEKGPEGKVLKILARSRKNLVGIVSSKHSDGALVYCPLLGPKNLVIAEDASPKKMPLEVGDRLYLEVTEWGTKTDNTRAFIARHLGNISDPKTDIPAAILENDIREHFPSDALEEALNYGNRVPKSDLAGRLDLTGIECFTIDPDTAKDFDDAISLEETESGYTLGVHIADVSHYVKNGSALDREARIRCNSTYFPGRAIPMLPPELSDNLCSLKEGVIRLTVSAFMNFSKAGDLIDWQIKRSFIKSKKRFTYKQAKEVLDGTLRSKHEKTLRLMVDFCNLLKQKRAERGSVQIYMPELYVHIDSHGMPSHTEVIQYDITHQLVEEFMLKANEVVAIDLTKRGKNVTFRIHEEPSKESLRDFSALALAFGYKLSDEPTPLEIQKFFAEIDPTSTISQYLATCYIRSMRLACYSPDNIGHYGLSLEYYCHFTSPIRRYVDTIVHRLLFEENIDREEITRICKNSSERERHSARAEGSVMQIKKLRLLDKLTQEDPTRQFEAVITRVKPFGVYFDVLDFMLEGFLHISELEDDYFIWDEAHNLLRGRYTKSCYKPGDRILVMKKNIDFILSETTWNLVEHVQETAVLEQIDKPISITPKNRAKKPRSKSTAMRNFGRKMGSKRKKR